MDNVEQILEFLFDTPPEGAVDYLKSQGYEVSANSDEIINAIKNHAFTVAKVATADKLQKIHDELKKAMDSGTPYKEWLKSVKDTIPGKTNWQTVYRTNMSSAYNSGRYVQQMASAEYMPFWQHFCPIDSRTRPLGHTLNGLIYRYDDPHWQTMYPPNEYNDRDRIGVLSEFAMQQQGLKAETEPPRDKDGKLYEPAKGFKGNPATSSWKPDLSKYSPEIRSELEKALKGKEIKPTEGVLKAEGKVNKFKPAKTVEEAEIIAKENGVTYANYKGWNIKAANSMNKALSKVPEKAIPDFIGSGSEWGKAVNRKIERSADSWFGVSEKWDSIHINGKIIADWNNKNPLTQKWYSSVGINVNKYKTAEDIESQKLKYNESYKKAKDGRTWYYNTKGEATYYHELGHIYDKTKYISNTPKWKEAANRWFNETNCDLLRSPSEAYAEAFANKYAYDGVDLPDYIKEFF